MKQKREWELSDYSHVNVSVAVSNSLITHESWRERRVLRLTCLPWERNACHFDLMLKHSHLELRAVARKNYDWGNVHATFNGLRISIGKFQPRKQKHFPFALTAKWNNTIFPQKARISSRSMISHRKNQFFHTNGKRSRTSTTDPLILEFLSGKE